MTPLNSELSFEVPDWIYLLFFSAVNQNLRSLENYQSWISELLFGTWSYGPGLQSVFDRVLHTDRYNMEIMSWKERAKDVYSQVAMHQKNELVSAANEWFFFIHCNEWPKVVPALLMVWCFYFKHSHIFHIWIRRLEANDCENTSFVQSETQMIILRSVNLSMYGIKSITSC